jgi:hypothetical protein
MLRPSPVSTNASAGHWEGSPIDSREDIGAEHVRGRRRVLIRLDNTSQSHRQERGNGRGPSGVLAGQLFEVIIKDESGLIVYVHSDRGFQRYLMMAPLHLRLAPGESHTETMEVPLVYSRGAEKGKPLPPGTYMLTVYLTAAQGLRPRLSTA